MDLPRYCGGHGSPRKSRPPHSITELSSNPQKSISRYITIRLHPRTSNRPTSIPFSNVPCTRRYLEHMGWRGSSFSYVERLYPYESPHKMAYEVRTGFLPLCSFSSIREASLHCIALRHFGIACHFVVVDVPILKPIRGI